MIPNQQPVVVTYYSRVYNNLSSKQLNTISIFVLVLGIAAFVINGVSYIFTTQFCDSLFLTLGHGFWLGVFFFISGGLGIGAAKSRTQCPIVACMVMAIISTSSASAMISLACVDIYYETSNFNSYPDYIYSHYRDTSTGCLISDICLLAVATISFILSIWQTVLCGSAVCCRPENTMVAPEVVQPSVPPFGIQTSIAAAGIQSNISTPRIQTATIAPGIYASTVPIDVHPAGVPIGYFYSNNVVVPFKSPTMANDEFPQIHEPPRIDREKRQIYNYLKHA